MRYVVAAAVGVLMIGLSVLGPDKDKGTKLGSEIVEAELIKQPIDTPDTDETHEVNALVESLPRALLDAVEYYIIDGDILLTRDEAIDYFVQRASEQTAIASNEIDLRDENEALLALDDDGNLSVWDGPHTTLTYQILEDEFESDHLPIIRAALAEAAQDWNLVCPNCRYEFSEFDATLHTEPLFTVRHTPTHRFVATAFFPHDPADRRVLWVSTSYFSDHAFSRAGIIRHEFGHILGFRHEHNQAPSLEQCQFEDDRWTAIGEYDANSVMHYLCDDGGSTDLEISFFDRVAVNAIYGSDRSTD